MYCSKCGANVADGIAFCSACGQPMVGFSVGPAARSQFQRAGQEEQFTRRPRKRGDKLRPRVPPWLMRDFGCASSPLSLTQLVLYFVGMILFLPFAGFHGMGMRGMMTARPPRPGRHYSL